MTELFEPVDVYDHRVADADGSLLATYNAAGVLTAGDLQIARRIATICDEPEEDVVLALALTVRAVRDGSVCLDLDRAAEVAPGLPWPEPGAWREKVAGSCVVSQGAVAVDEGLVYLDRYHRLELAVCADLSARERRAAPVVDDTVLETALDRAFPRAAAPGARDYTEQRRAAERAARSWTTVLTGGPGTGKTTTVAGLICVLADQARDGRRLSVALAAPTGKAAARLQESVLEEATDARFSDDDRRRLQHMDAVTLHRLLGWRPDNATRFRHDRGNRLKYDLVVVDESSMVELTLMARLLEATRADCRLVLVGDPHQLTSVGAGAVLGDLVRGYQRRAASRASPASPVVTLETSHRFGDEIGALARAVREDRLDEVLERLRSGVPAIEFVEDPDPEPLLRELVLTSAREVRAAAERGDADEALRARGRGLARRGVGERPLAALVRRAAADRDQQRLCGRRLQRRDRGRRTPPRRCAARTHLRLRRHPRPGDHTTRRRRHHARPDHPQVPGQPGGRGHRAASPGRLAAAVARALLHRDHEGATGRAGDRVGADGA
jgi:exodeoxyribonuclease V alpha subunit